MAVNLTADQRAAIAAGQKYVTVKLTADQRAALLAGDTLELSGESTEVEYVAVNRNSGAIVWVVDDASGNSLRYRILRWAGGAFNLGDDPPAVELRDHMGQRFREEGGWTRTRITP